MTTRYPLIGSTPCLDPGKLYTDRTAAPQDFWGLANSISCPTGIHPGSAFLVVTRAVNDALEMNSTHSISWSHENGVTTWPDYTIVRQWFVGVDGDSKSAALVELQDKRCLMRGAANFAFNIRRHSGGTYSSGSTATGQFYTDSLDSGTPYTWQRVLNDLWTYLPAAIRGTAPTLPYEPLNRPENLRYFGDAWEAVGDLLARCQSKLAFDPIAGTFSVVRIGEAQPGLAGQVEALKSRVMFDATPRQNLNLAAVPEKIRFYFPKYGIPTQTDAGGQIVRPYYTIDKPTNLAGCQAGTVKPYKTSFQAIYNNQADADAAAGLAQPLNQTELENLASELARKIADKIDLGSERGRIIYSGVVTSIPLGSEVAHVQWRDLGTQEGCVTDVRTAEELPDGEDKGINVVPQRDSTAILQADTSIAASVCHQSTYPWQDSLEHGPGKVYLLKKYPDGSYKHFLYTSCELINATPFYITNTCRLIGYESNGQWVISGFHNRGPSFWASATGVSPPAGFAGNYVTWNEGVCNFGECGELIAFDGVANAALSNKCPGQMDFQFNGSVVVQGSEMLASTATLHIYGALGEQVFVSQCTTPTWGAASGGSPPHTHSLTPSGTTKHVHTWHTMHTLPPGGYAWITVGADVVGFSVVSGSLSMIPIL